MVQGRPKSEFEKIKRNEIVYRNIRFERETLEEYRDRLQADLFSLQEDGDRGNAKRHFIDRVKNRIGYNLLTKSSVIDLLEYELENLQSQKPQ
ncbi:MAG: hypothetical protein F4Z31_06185 [Gemmatimonadetes bacterium]|nr:hypothetical protein [Gemmatimonadota bacterium]